MKILVKMLCTKQRNWATRKYLPFIFPFFAVNPSERESRETKKKEGKVKGSQAIFYSMTVNKNIVHRSKVHLCTAVVWGEKHTYLNWGRYVRSTLLLFPLCTVVISRVCFCKVPDAGAVTMMPALQRSTYRWADSLSIPTFTTQKH